LGGEGGANNNPNPSPNPNDDDDDDDDDRGEGGAPVIFIECFINAKLPEKLCHRRTGILLLSEMATISF